MRAFRPRPGAALSLAGVLLSLWPLDGRTQGDPTQPPPRPVRAAAAAASTPEVATPPPPAPIVQSIQFRRGGDSSAIVDGQLLRIGDRLGEATVAAIDEQGLTLRGARGPQRLLLWPAYRITRAVPEAPPAVTTAGGR